ncbi:MAG: amidohydrolase family protein, partial [Desulfobacterales bacterium]|nr:amidohydrolase family protein [Desulfobacterales bacterium]
MNPVNRPNASRRELMDVALGRLPADLIINNADVFNVWTGQVRKNMQVLVRKDRIAHVGGMESEGNTGDGARVIDAGGKVLIPGFIDSHTHLAWLVKPDQYAGRILPLGCTTVITETMEIYPVAGISGVREYISALQKQPMRFYTTLPAMTTINRSCMGVTGKDAKALAALDGMAGVGEAYWQTVLQNPDSFLPLFDRILASGKVLEGHSAGAWGRKLSAYAALGVTSCHEAVSAEQVMERLEKGFHVQIREGSIRSELAALSAIAGQDIDLSNISLVSDGVTPGDLLSRGYMETIVQKAIDGGFRPDDAIRMATLNPARHFRLDHDIG